MSKLKLVKKKVVMIVITLLISIIGSLLASAIYFNFQADKTYTNLITNHTFTRSLEITPIPTSKTMASGVITQHPTMTKQSVGAEVESEIFYDDGSIDGDFGLGGRAHAVRFTPPTELFKLTGVKIYGKTRKGGGDGQFTIAIWDEDFNELYRVTHKYSDYLTEQSRWVSIEIHEIIIQPDFYIVLDTGTKPPPGPGIYLGFDTDPPYSGRSYLAWIDEFMKANWTLEITQEETEWMIRAVGKPYNGIQTHTSQIEELAYDDGNVDSFLSFDSNRGFAVFFSPDIKPWALEKINIYGYRKNDKDFTMEIWDKEGKVLSVIGPYKYSMYFSTSKKWVEIPIQSVIVDGDFYICLFTYSNPEVGIYVGYAGSKSGDSHSYMVFNDRKTVAEWSIKNTREETNWMIRAVIKQYTIISTKTEG